MLALQVSGAIRLESATGLEKMKTAYVTTLCNGDSYLPGVEALGKSLEKSGTSTPRVVMVTSDVSRSARDRLARLGWQLRDIDPIVNPRPLKLRMFRRFDSVFTKLRAWELTEFDRVVLLDADTLVMQNVDDLFERSHFAAAPDFFKPDNFNSGVMVLEPARETFRRMAEAIGVTDSYDGGDQGFLNQFFPDWYGMAIEHRLPVGYNTAHFIYQFMRAHHGARAELEDKVKIIHYLVQKPWKVRSTLTGGSAAWWQSYNLAHPEGTRGWKDRAHDLEDWTFDRLAALVLD
jgi:alpha-N-acetylglucosamine transferase